MTVMRLTITYLLERYSDYRTWGGIAGALYLSPRQVHPSQRLLKGAASDMGLINNSCVRTVTPRYKKYLQANYADCVICLQNFCEDLHSKNMQRQWSCWTKFRPCFNLNVAAMLSKCGRILMLAVKGRHHTAH